MPRGRYGRKRGRRARSAPSYRRRRRKKHRKKLPYELIPKKAIRRLRYHTQVNINPGAGVAGYHIFSANGMFDPDITGVGHQPMGFDQMMVMYDHYHVIGAKCVARFYNTDAASATPAWVGISCTDDALLSSSSVEKLVESGKTTKKFLMKPATGGANYQTVTKKCSPPKYTSVSKPLSENNLSGSATANPVEQVYFAVWIGPVDSTDLGNYGLVVTIDYIAVFTEPKIMAQS